MKNAGDDSLDRLVRRLLRKYKNAPGSFTVTCRFPNDDVPKFLKALDEFERKSAKTKLMVRFKPSNAPVSRRRTTPDDL